MKKLEKIIVTKCDGGVERFSFAKLRNCLVQALRDCDLDERLGDPLARAVAAHLREWDRATLPTTDYIYQCVGAVLRETGLDDAAGHMDHHRRLRRQRRSRVRVVGEGRASRPWRKAMVSASLQREYGITPAVARYVAGRIEEHVLELGVRVIAREYLNEMVRREVLAWGLIEVPVAAFEAAMSAEAAALPRPDQKKR